MKQPNQRPPAVHKGKKPFPVRVLAVAIAFVLGGGGAIGAYIATTGSLPASGNGNSLFVGTTGLRGESAVFSVPTDATGNNQFGNMPENIAAGGLITYQGDYAFFADPGDGGRLRVESTDGTFGETLTSFAVANINVTGDQLVFTDLSACQVVDTNGSVRVFAAQDQDDAAAKAEDNQFSLGGTLYIVNGVSALCDGHIGPEALEVRAFGSDGSEGYSQVISTPNGMYMVGARSGQPDVANMTAAEVKPVIALMSTSPRQVASIQGNGTFVVWVDVHGKKHYIPRIDSSKHIIKVVTDFDHLAVEDSDGVNEANNTITHYSLKTNRPTSRWRGSQLQSATYNITKRYFFYRNATDGLIYQMDPDSTAYSCVSRIPPSGAFTVNPSYGRLTYFADTGLAGARDIHVTLSATQLAGYDEFNDGGGGTRYTYIGGKLVDDTAGGHLTEPWHIYFDLQYNNDQDRETLYMHLGLSSEVLWYGDEGVWKDMDGNVINGWNVMPELSDQEFLPVAPVQGSVQQRIDIANEAMVKILMSDEQGVMELFAEVRQSDDVAGHNDWKRVCEDLVTEVKNVGTPKQLIEMTGNVRTGQGTFPMHPDGYKYHAEIGAYGERLYQNTFCYVVDVEVIRHYYGGGVNQVGYDNPENKVSYFQMCFNEDSELIFISTHEGSAPNNVEYD